MKKAPQKAKDLVCEYLRETKSHEPESGKLRGEITSALVGKDPRGFSEGVYGLAIDNLVNDKTINTIYSDEPSKVNPKAVVKIRGDLAESGISGWLYWIKDEKK